jgi:hypothetical protein
MLQKKIKVDQMLHSILNGEYSWACVLFLREFGYDPLSYIPYRTYVRLLGKPREYDNKHEEYKCFHGDTCDIEEALRCRKYSWACTLILYSFGIDPKLYIPQRTLSRITSKNTPIIQKIKCSKL